MPEAVNSISAAGPSTRLRAQLRIWLVSPPGQPDAAGVPMSHRIRRPDAQRRLPGGGGAGFGNGFIGDTIEIRPPAELVSHFCFLLHSQNLADGCAVRRAGGIFIGDVGKPVHSKRTQTRALQTPQPLFADEHVREAPAAGNIPVNIAMGEQRQRLKEIPREIRRCRSLNR